MPLFSWLGRARRGSAVPLFSVIDLDPAVQRVLLTGAAGNVAQLLLPLVRPHAPQWRLTDECHDLAANFGERRIQRLGAGSLADGLFDGVDAVVHLAGQAKPAPLDVLRRDNVEATKWLLEQMRAAGITRLVYASSMHVMGRYRRDERVTPDLEPRPSDAYGASKLEAERRIRDAAESWGLRAFVLRMGHVAVTAASAEPGNWLATDDLARLVAIGMHRARAGVTVVHAVSPHRGDDLGQREVTDHFGMAWRRDAPAYRDAMRRVDAWYRDDTIARQFRGGVFASGQAQRVVAD